MGSTLDAEDRVAAAATTAINRRAADSYLHDLRGSLQAVYGAVELLTRVGLNAAAGTDRLEKAAALAKRAVANHDALVNTLLNRALGGAAHAPLIDSSISYSALIQEAIFFCRHESERRQVTLRYAAAVDPVAITAESDRLFVLLVGLFQLALDTAPDAATLDVRLNEEAGNAVLSVELGDRAGDPQVPDAAAFEYARNYFEASGGTLSIVQAAEVSRRLVARAPLA